MHDYNAERGRPEHNHHTTPDESTAKGGSADGKSHQRDLAVTRRTAFTAGIALGTAALVWR